VISTLHTADLSDADRKRIRGLMDHAFHGEFSDADWDHTLGGMHALLRDGDDVVAHGSVVQRRLLHGGVAVRTGYVEGVAVRADLRGRGYGAAVMDRLEDIIRRAYDLGALGAAEGAEGFHSARGWRVWQGRTSMLTPSGIVPTPDEDGSIFVLQVESGATLDLSGELVCDWREGGAW
jgi:aminoglycoside 2'-N-acetyltransferase I